MKSIIVATLAAFLILASVFQAIGEELTAEQKEVWSVVEKYYSYIANGDVASTVALMHDNSLELFAKNSLPLNKDLIKYAYNDWANVKPKIMVKPISINVIDHSVANAFYYWKWDTTLGDWSGKGRAMQTFIKQGDKWISIGAIYSKCSTPPPCPGW